MPFRAFKPKEKISIALLLVAFFGGFFFFAVWLEKRPKYIYVLEGCGTVVDSTIGRGDASLYPSASNPVLVFSVNGETCNYFANAAEWQSISKGQRRRIEAKRKAGICSVTQVFGPCE